MIGKMGHGKTGGVPGEKGAPGDKGVPGEDGEVEKAAQLLCSGEMLLWGSAEEEGLKFETTNTYTLHPPQGQPRGWGEQAQTQNLPLGGPGRAFWVLVTVVFIHLKELNSLLYYFSGVQMNCSKKIN